MAKEKTSKASAEKAKDSIKGDVVEAVVIAGKPEKPSAADRSKPTSLPSAHSSAKPRNARSTHNKTDDTPKAAEPAVVKRVGFFPVVGGGVVAAVIGFGAAVYLSPGGWPLGADQQAAFEAEITASLAAQNQTINGLRGQVTELAAQSNTDDIAADASAALGAAEALKTQVAALSAKMNDLQFRLTDLEKRPITEGISDAAIAAFEGELQSVQEAMAAQRAEIEAATAAATQMEAKAQISEAEALKRAALSQIQTALNVGSGFGPAVKNLQAVGEDVPQVLVAAASAGVPSVAALQEAFPAAARATLAATQNEASEDSGFGAFLRKQLGARSLEPKAGNSADAILSRAEAALGEGRLLDATAELQELPEGGQAAMAGWLADASKRQQALAAVETLSQQLISN